MFIAAPVFLCWCWGKGAFVQTYWGSFWPSRRWKETVDLSACLLAPQKCFRSWLQPTSRFLLKARGELWAWQEAFLGAGKPAEGSVGSMRRLAQLPVRLTKSLSPGSSTITGVLAWPSLVPCKRLQDPKLSQRAWEPLHHTVTSNYCSRCFIAEKTWKHSFAVPVGNHMSDMHCFLLHLRLASHILKPWNQIATDWPSVVVAHMKCLQIMLCPNA